MQRVVPKAEEPDPRERALAHTLGLPPIVARVLLARGLDDPRRVRTFLQPDLGSLHDPFAFRDMKKAVDRIRAALRHQEPILIHGDYDVDGITGTVLLHKFFGLVHGTSRAYVPARADGYSLSRASVDAILAGGFKLVISVDNGTNAKDPIAELQRAGVDVIVTDHHGTSDNVADAFAVLNPRLPDAGYPDHDLAGCGVAFRLAAAVASSFAGSRLQSPEFGDFLTDAMTYVALGTVADVAPLRGENRTLVFHGLRALAQSRNPGIRALLDAAGLLHRGADVEDIGFRIAPLLNAAGRVGHANDAIALLCAPGYREAQVAAKVLESHNEERRRVERQLQDEVLGTAIASPDPAVVLASDRWHPGVLGIVAARATEACGKPVLLVAWKGDVGRGSGRCAAGSHLRNLLAECGDELVAHGGHAAAAGFEVRRDRFEAFRERFVDACRRAPPGEDRAPIDGLAQLDELDPHTVRRLDMLGPFGTGHHRPRFATRGVRTVGHPLTDARGQDLRIRVAAHGQVLPARLVRGGSRFEEIRRHQGPWTIVYSPRINTRGEDGPVQLDVHRLVDEHDSRTTPSLP